MLNQSIFKSLLLISFIVWFTPLANSLEVDLVPNKQYSKHYANNSYTGSFSPLNSQSLILKFTSEAGNVSISLVGFGVDYVGEVYLSLDGSEEVFLQPTGNFTHGTTETFDLGEVSEGNHVIEIKNFNPAYTWGVSDILITAPTSPTRRLNILNFGASVESGNNDTDAFNNVIDYVNLHGDNSKGENLKGFDVYLPAGVYDLPVGLNEIHVDNVHFSGGVSGGTFIHAANGILFHYSGSVKTDKSVEPFWVVGGGVRDITVKYDSPPGPDAMIIKSTHSARQTYENIRVKNVGGIAQLGDSISLSAQQMFRNITGWVANVGKPAFNCINGAGLFISDSNIFVQDVPVPINGQPSIAAIGQDFLACSGAGWDTCLLYTSPSPRDATLSRMPSSA